MVLGRLANMPNEAVREAESSQGPHTVCPYRLARDGRIVDHAFGNIGLAYTGSPIR